MGGESARAAGGAGGLSRRGLLRAGITAGALAWTTPVIVDSITSPAGALSPCVKYYMKLAGDSVSTTAGNCYNAAPACSSSTSGTTGGNTPANSNVNTNGGYTWVCAGSNPSSHPKFRSSFTAVTINGNSYYRIVLANGCVFSSSQTTYAVVGNYNFSGTGTCRALPAGASNATGPAANTVGIYQNGGNTAWIRRTFDSQTLNWIYLEFCCTS